MYTYYIALLARERAIDEKVENTIQKVVTQVRDAILQYKWLCATGGGTRFMLRTFYVGIVLIMCMHYSYLLTYASRTGQSYEE